MSAAHSLPFINPATGERFGEVAAATPADARQAVAELRQAAPAWAALPVRERVRVLRQLQGALIEARDELSLTITRNSGKSRQVALIEVFVTLDMLDTLCRNAPRWLRREKVSSGLYLFKRFYAEPRPFGVVAVIAPWNYPLILALQPLVTALMAGNAVVLKPSEVTAAVGVAVQRLLESVPALRPVTRVLHGDGSVGAAVVEAAPDFIYLTGSTATGKRVLRAAAEHVIPVVCELGGKDPMLVLDDADIDAAARWGVWGAFFNAGQTCVGIKRVYVDAAVYDEFVDKAVAATRALKQGYCLDEGPCYDLGPMALAAQMEKVEQHVADALAKGARVLTGGRRTGQYYEPTVMVDVTHDMLLMQEETFGPVMPIMRVRDEVEAVALANDSPYGLSASVWSRSQARARRVAAQLQAGAVLINDSIAHFAVPSLPFGGTKQSGFGRAHGKAGLLTFTQSVGYAVGDPPHPLDPATLLRQPGSYRFTAALMRVLFGVKPRQRLEPLAEVAGEQAARLRPARAALGLSALAALAAAVFAFGRRSARRRPR